MMNRDTYIEGIKLQLDELKSGIDNLEGKTHIAEVTIMTAYQREVRGLRLQLQKAHAKLDEIMATGENAWEDLKSELEHTRDALAHSLRDFNSRN